MQISVAEGAAVARERLSRDLVAVRSLWFPTPVELRHWRETSAPLYVSWRRHAGFDVGPRTESIYAARFCPVLRARLHEAPDGTVQITATTRFTTATLVVALGWWGVVALWGAVELQAVLAGTTHPAILGFWGFLALSTVGGTALGWVVGRRLLRERAPWLRMVLTDAARERQDW